MLASVRGQRRKGEECVILDETDLVLARRLERDPSSKNEKQLAWVAEHTLRHCTIASVDKVFVTLLS